MKQCITEIRVCRLCVTIVLKWRGAFAVPMKLFYLILLNEYYHLSQYIFFENLSTCVEVTIKVHVILDFPSYM